MKSHLILPATIAAGLHALLLLGFKFPPPSPTLALPTEETEPFYYTSISDIEPPCLCVEESSSIDQPVLPPPDRSVPQLPEHYEIESSVSDRQKLVIPPASPGLPDDKTTVIPTNWGSGDGSDPREVVFDRDALDRAPTVLFRESPHVDRDRMDANAVVTVMFVVGKDGRVVDASVVDSTNRQLEDECLRAVRRWRFEPGTRFAVPVAFRVQQTFVFNPTN